MVILEGGGEGFHHPAQIVGFGRGEILLFKRIIGQVEELIVGAPETSDGK